MILQTIRSRDGKLVVHGSVVWSKGDEFGFIPQGMRVSEQWWCKLDYWELIENRFGLYKLSVS